MNRFDPDAEELRDSLQWHAHVTAELQGRIVRAREYVLRSTGDKQLLAILGSREGD